MDIQTVTYMAKDYDEAIAYFSEKWGFVLLQDEVQVEYDRRFVLVAPNKTTAMRLLIKQAKTPEEQALVGRQAGDDVFLFLQTEAFEEEYAQLKAKQLKANGVRFLRSLKIYMETNGILSEIRQKIGM
ncbi:VOC family protein [Enterococcus bulliens]